MDAVDDLKWVLLMLFFLFLAWLVTGGPQRAASQPGLFIKPLAPVGSGAVYGRADVRIATGTPEKPAQPQKIAGESADAIEKEIARVKEALKKLQGAAQESPFKDMVRIEQGNAVDADVNREYVRLRVDRGAASKKIPISGWQIKSAVTGRSASIGTASDLLFPGSIASTPIVVSPGDTIIVSSGRSPKGVSFRVNICSGYFGQFQDFLPLLSQECPLVIAGGNLPKPPNALSDACLDYIDRIPRCQIALNIPQQIAYQCGDYITTNATYAACVAQHREDPDFERPEWRVYVGNDNELWKAQREVLTLLDGQGKVVDSISY